MREGVIESVCIVYLIFMLTNCFRTFGGVNSNVDVKIGAPPNLNERRLE